ncbi:MAG: response regulator transcription factor [Bacteroidetes bacterium]|nr:response regulator transcription factor [Bacteroidota bacterium]
MEKKLNVLLVDDSQIILSHLKEMLLDVKTVEVLNTATTIGEAKTLVEQHKPDLIILDIQLPDGNGILFLKVLKQQHPEIVVVILTNMADAFIKAAAEKYGADYFLDKAMDFAKIPQLLSEVKPK